MESQLCPVVRALLMGLPAVGPIIVRLEGIPGMTVGITGDLEMHGTSEIEMLGETKTEIEGQRADMELKSRLADHRKFFIIRGSAA